MARSVNGHVVLEGEGIFEVTIHGALAEQFNRWLDRHDQCVTAFGTNDAGTPVYVATIRAGTPTGDRLMEMLRGEPDG